MGLTTIIALLSQVLTLVPQGSAIFERFSAQRTQAQQWADTGHVPTDAEWAALDASIKANEDAIDAAAARP